MEADGCYGKVDLGVLPPYQFLMAKNKMLGIFSPCDTHGLSFFFLLLCFSAFFTSHFAFENILAINFLFPSVA